jgi:hypothetical protein
MDQAGSIRTSAYRSRAAAGVASTGCRSWHRSAANMNPAWQELLTTDVGLMSLAVLVGIGVIAVVLFVIVRRKMNEPS